MSNLNQNITPVKNQFWSTHICWDFCAGKGHSLLQTVLMHRLLQEAHGDDDVSWPVDTFLAAYLCWVHPGNPGWNPKASKFSSSLLWFTMQRNLPISSSNCKQEVNQLEKAINTRISSFIACKCNSAWYILISEYEKHKAFEGKYRTELCEGIIFDRKSCVNCYWPYYKGWCWWCFFVPASKCGDPVPCNFPCTYEV